MRHSQARQRRETAVVALATLVVGIADGSAAGADEIGGWATTHVLVRVRPGVEPAVLDGGRLTLIQHADALPNAEMFAAGQAVADTFERWQVAAVEPVFENGFADPKLARRLGLDRMYRAHVPPGTDTPALVADLDDLDDVIARAALDGIGGVADVIPDDPDFGEQWGMLNTGQNVAGETGVPGADINVTPAWEISTGSGSLVLAVLDAGMDEHIEIVNRMIPGRNVAAEPDNDDTSDVCISHGTHVAGIAGADANNGEGVAGVDWSVQIMPVRVLNGCTGPESFVAEGLVWAADNGADVINMSLQYFSGSEALELATAYAYAQGVVMVAATGNQGASAIAFPARWPETIAVGAMNNLDERWSSSNYGPELDVMGPGVDVWSLRATTEYQFLSGTSMATPHVSGTVCLLKARDPALTAEDVRQILHDTAVDMLPPGEDDLTGFGRIDTEAALLAVPVLGDLDGDGLVGSTDLLILLASWGNCSKKACPPACVGDLDEDCNVNTLDLLILLGNWTA